VKDPISNSIKISLLCICVFFGSSLLAHEDPPVPVPAATVIIDQDAAVRLGRALFWDQQLGGGNGALMACASCHYQAGTDSHPARVDAGILDNGHLASLGVQFSAFNSLDCDAANCQAADNCSGTGSWLRTGVQSPPVVESNTIHSFWDGRANNTFNGVNESGNSAHGIFERDDQGFIVQVEVAFSDSAQASQAIPPANSAVEMACHGRTFPELGYKMLRVEPLALQTGAVASDVQATNYADLIAATFDPRFVGNEAISEADPIRSGDPANPSPQPSLTEQNFSMFFGLAIQAYEQSLEYGGRTPTAAELVSMNNLQCDFCHADGLSSAMLDASSNQNAFTNTAVELVRGSPGVSDPRVGPSNVGLFKTSHLLNLRLTAPYFHTGTAGDLSDVLEFYVNGGCGGLITDPDFCDGNAVTANTLINLQVAPLAEDITNVQTMMEDMLDPRICAGTDPYTHPSLTLWLDDGDPESDITMNPSDSGLGLDYLSDNGVIVNCSTLLTAVDPPTLNRAAFSASSARWRIFGSAASNDNSTTVEAFLIDGGVTTLIGSAATQSDGSWAVRVNDTTVEPTDETAGIRIETSSGGVVESFGTIEFR
jgi:cytochrome c peroxidase